MKHVAEQFRIDSLNDFQVAKPSLEPKNPPMGFRIQMGHAQNIFFFFFYLLFNQFFSLHYLCPLKHVSSPLSYTVHGKSASFPKLLKLKHRRIYFDPYQKLQ